MNDNYKSPYRSQGRRKSRFPANTTIPSDATFDFVSNGVNYKITVADFFAALGVTGTIVQAGAETGTPVLDPQGSVNAVRNLENGPGVKAQVSPENGITLEHNFAQDAGGVPILLNAASEQPIFVSLSGGPGVSVELKDGVIVFSDGIPLSSLSTQTDGVTVPISAQDTPVRIEGTWNNNGSSGFEVSGDGRVTYEGSAPKEASISASVTTVSVGGGQDAVTAYVAIGGSPIPESGTPGSTPANPEAITLVWRHLFQPGDYVELFIENNSDTSDISVPSCTLRIS